MRISELLSLGIEYLILGCALAAVFGLAVWLFRRIYFKGTKSNPGHACKVGRQGDWKKILLFGLVVCYLAVVFGATALSRGAYYGGYGGSIRLHPFYSYRDAWNDFSVTEWRNIILNIVMFVPWGFFLPMLHPKFKKAGWTYLAGLILTLMIEGIQLLWKRGIFELDDIFHNFIGAVIGYGLWHLWKLFRSMCVSKQYPEVLTSLAYQVPLLVIIFVFASIFISYANQELGNLESDYIVRQKVVNVTTELEFSEEVYKVPVYRLFTADKEDTMQKAEEVFAKFDAEVDTDRIDVYEKTIVYWSKDSKNIWIDYTGMPYKYSDFSLLHEENGLKSAGNVAEESFCENAEDTVRQALEEVDIVLPKGVSFRIEDGEYCFVADKLVQNEIFYDGILRCKYTLDGFSWIDNMILESRWYKDDWIISEAEAFRRLQAGEFFYPYDAEWDIAIYDAYLAYEADSKGFYQPVYRFDAVINANDGYIIIPALQNRKTYIAKDAR